ncbi:MAG: putative toxin-antitoxin system toxin component, PIN family [Gemmatimonadales bacterium]
MRVCFDTNVLVSAVATRGICADLMNLVLAEHEVVLGETVLSELKRVLERKVRVPKATTAELDAFLRQRATVISASRQAPEGALDAADAAVLAEAAAGADVLVTGDRQLLELPRPPIPIVSPRGLWDLLRTTS